MLLSIFQIHQKHVAIRKIRSFKHTLSKFCYDYFCVMELWKIFICYFFFIPLFIHSNCPLVVKTTLYVIMLLFTHRTTFLHIPYHWPAVIWLGSGPVSRKGEMMYACLSGPAIKPSRIYHSSSSPSTEDLRSRS